MAFSRFDGPARAVRCAAHGSRISSEEYVQVVRDIKLLNIVLNPMLIGMTNVSNSYMDYYSTDHPVRNICEPVPVLKYRYPHAPQEGGAFQCYKAALEEWETRRAV
jgi:hypothetical protein